MQFAYDPAGNRILKKTINPDGSFIKTYYIRDAQGNIMATYTLEQETFTWQSSLIYGSSRLGVYYARKTLYNSSGPVIPEPLNINSYTRGQKNYELTNHLGNVLAVISNRKTAIAGSSTTFQADVVSISDYYPFGMQMTGRTWVASSTEKYRFGFNGQMKDDEIYGEGNVLDFGARIYDGRLARWMSLDPLQMKFPDYSPYCFALLNPIYLIDFDGRDIKPSTGWLGSDYEKLFTSYQTQNNESFMTIFKYFDNNNEKVNLILKYENKDENGNKFKSNVIGETYPSDINSSTITMNPDYEPDIIGKWNDDPAWTALAGRPILSRYVQSDIGKSHSIMHEMIHAYINQEIPELKRKGVPQHNLMGQKDGEYLKMMQKFLTDANNANGWGLSENDILDISYFGLQPSKSFTDFISTKAGLPENWQEEKDEKVLQGYKDTYNKTWAQWKKNVDQHMLRKETKQKN